MVVLYAALLIYFRMLCPFGGHFSVPFEHTQTGHLSETNILSQ